MTLFTKKRKQSFNYDPEVMFRAASQHLRSIYGYCKTTTEGLSDEEVVKRQSKYGKNVIAHEKKLEWITVLVKAFMNPFIGILTFLILISFVMDVWMAEAAERDWTTVLILIIMILVSSLLRFWQEMKSLNATEALKGLVKNTCTVYRRNFNGPQEISMEQLVPGDVVYLSAGDMIPGDLRIVESKDLYISQSSLTGESEPIEKHIELQATAHKTASVTELDNICFMGTNVVSGAAKAIVIATGEDTYLGQIAHTLVGHRAETSFDRGINKVSMLLIKYMLIMVPIVFFVNGIMKGDWLEAFIFGISVAVGLTPEMLPMIVNANLAKGSLTMAKKKVVAKNMNTIQSFGAMNILCTDKTGTLTRDNIVLERYMDVNGNPDATRVLSHAYYNSYFQTGLKNVMDKAILAHCDDLGLEMVSRDYRKVDEIPFDFIRRRMSVIVEGKEGKQQIITKGAIEEMLQVCTFVETDGKVAQLTPALRDKVLKKSSEFNREGLRVLGVAHKTWYEGEIKTFGPEDEKEMVLIGYLAFLDPPKESAVAAIKQLHEHGVEVKVLSGDNGPVTQTISQRVGIEADSIMLGVDVDAMSDAELEKAVVEYNVFAKLTPMNKARIVTTLQRLDHTVGFLGDGINDSAALRQADIGISVDTAVDIAKEAADIILLEKDLIVLEKGVEEGRRIFGNIMKYIKMTASSNFGNMFSVLVASAFLPFLPMLPIHLLVQNLLYDISQTMIPFDTVDADYLKKPRKWDANDLSRFMVWIGPISSIFDISTYAVLWYVFGCNNADSAALFQSGWFIEGLLSQTLIVHMIRTRKIPFIQSRASWPLMILTISIIILGMCIPFTALGHSIGFVDLPPIYFLWLWGTLLAYCVIAQVIKNWYCRKFVRWL